MYILTRRYRSYRGPISELARIVNLEVVPLLQGIDGFVEFFAVDNSDGTLLGIGVFKDVASANDAELRLREYVGSSRVAQLFPEKAESTIGSVIAHGVLEIEKKTA